MEYPRVIILGETFRVNGGGGITMTNLFMDWPSSHIGVITDRINETNPLSACNYYQLGDEEIRFPFPFSLIQGHVVSGPVKPGNEGTTEPKTEHANRNKPGLKNSIRKWFDLFLKKTGLNFIFYSIKLSGSLKKWILDFKPDIIYIQPFHYRIMKFGNLLFSELNIPYVTHIMDDSVKYINGSKILKNHIQGIIDKDFTQLIHNAALNLCISEAMGDEYYKRYNRKFLPFRNPIDTDKWLEFSKGRTDITSEGIKVIYNGRLFSPTHDSLLDFCRIVNDLNKKGKHVELHIYTYDNNTSFRTSIGKMEGIKIFPPVKIKDVPELISRYDVFFMCLDFDKEAQKYSQFSISTRTSEGMISGVPVLLYAPPNTAMFKYFKKHNAGCIVGGKDPVRLEEALIKLMEENDYRHTISRNAVTTALFDSNSIEVRKKFKEALTTL
ncbi:MAG TPA: glycosyltransferase [Bacteroidales bacterium]|nr:glycosyltransferase [Bacteroidales bacterium]